MITPEDIETAARWTRDTGKHVEPTEAMALRVKLETGEVTVTQKDLDSLATDQAIWPGRKNEFKIIDYVRHRLWQVEIMQVMSQPGWKASACEDDDDEVDEEDWDEEFEENWYRENPSPDGDW